MPRFRTTALSAIAASAIIVIGFATKAMLPAHPTGADIMMWSLIYIVCGLCLTISLTYL